MLMPLRLVKCGGLLVGRAETGSRSSSVSVARLRVRASNGSSLSAACFASFVSTSANRSVASSLSFATLSSIATVISGAGVYISAEVLISGVSICVCTTGSETIVSIEPRGTSIAGACIAARCSIVVVSSAAVEISGRRGTGAVMAGVVSSLSSSKNASSEGSASNCCTASCICTASTEMSGASGAAASVSRAGDAGAVSGMEVTGISAVTRAGSALVSARFSGSVVSEIIGVSCSAKVTGISNSRATGFSVMTCGLTISTVGACSATDAMTGISISSSSK